MILPLFSSGVLAGLGFLALMPLLALTDAFWITLPATIGAIFAGLGMIASLWNRSKIKEVHDAVNGMNASDKAATAAVAENRRDRDVTAAQHQSEAASATRIAALERRIDELTRPGTH